MIWVFAVTLAWAAPERPLPGPSGPRDIEQVFHDLADALPPRPDAPGTWVNPPRAVPGPCARFAFASGLSAVPLAISTTTWDGAHKVQSVEWDGGALRQITRWTYTPAGALALETDVAVRDDGRYTLSEHRYLYTDDGREWAVTTTDWTDRGLLRVRETTNRFDADGRLIGMTILENPDWFDRSERVFTFELDAEARHVRERVTKDGALESDVRYERDREGRVTRVVTTSGSGAITDENYSFDKQGRRTPPDPEPFEHVRDNYGNELSTVDRATGQFWRYDYACWR